MKVWNVYFVGEVLQGESTETANKQKTFDLS